MRRAEVIAIGSELLLGQIIDTNSPYLARILSENGIELIRTQTVGDDFHRIEEALSEAIKRSEIVITTGGIGPTEDDLTRDVIAHISGCPLIFQPHLMEQIEGIFKRRGFRMTENNRKQAYIPYGSIPIENPKGTAPGFIVENKNSVIISLPGVPHEMKFLMENTVIPYLRKRFNLTDQIIHYKVLRVCGLGESAIGIQIKDLMKQDQNPSVGTLASIGDIKIRITAKADNKEEASSLIGGVEKEIRKRLGNLIYGEDDETLQGNICKEMERLGLKISVVETFTGGLISNKLANTESQSFIQGLILSSEISIRRFLRISKVEFDFINNDPKQLASLMAKRVRNEYGGELGFSCLGRILNKDFEGEYKMESFYCLDTPSGLESKESILGGELLAIKERASIIALDFIRKYLLSI